MPKALAVPSFPEDSAIIELKEGFCRPAKRESIVMTRAAGSQFLKKRSRSKRGEKVDVDITMILFLPNLSERKPPGSWDIAHAASITAKLMPTSATLAPSLSRYRGSITHQELNAESITKLVMDSTATLIDSL
jgi:hypothetical protein